MATSGPNDNNTMKHSVHQIFQRKHEQELPSLREASPLLKHHNPLQGVAGIGAMLGGISRNSRNSSNSSSSGSKSNCISSSSLYHDPEHGLLFPSTKKSRAKSHWKKVQRYVLQGDVLLQSVVQPNLHIVVDHPTTIEQGGSNGTRQDRIQRKIEEIRSGTEFHLWHGLLCIAIYLSMSVAFYNHILEPDWTMLDSMYFAIVTVTTVGYGDEFPTSNASRVFTCLYALSGISILGIALGIIGSNLMDAQETLSKKAADVLKTRVLSVFDHDGTASTPTTTPTRPISSHSSLVDSVCSCFGTYLPLMVIIFGIACFIGRLSGWTLVETFYYMIMTGTTVGYGDYAPRTEQERMVGLFFIPLAVGAMGVWLSSVAGIVLESRSAQYRKGMRMKDLTQQDLEVMDRDGNGTVTRAEFLEFMLIAMNKIDQELVDELRMHFDRLDTDGTGELTKDDLIQVARAKLRNPLHKLRLATYKKRLLEQGRHRGQGQRHKRRWYAEFLNSLTRTQDFNSKNG